MTICFYVIYKERNYVMNKIIIIKFVRNFHWEEDISHDTKYTVKGIKILKRVKEAPRTDISKKNKVLRIIDKRIENEPQKKFHVIFLYFG